MTERMITVTLPAVEAALLEKATDEVPRLLTNAADTFRLLWSAIAGGQLEGHVGIMAVCELSARALEAAADDEGVMVDRLNVALREAIAAADKATSAATAEARRNANKGSASE